MSRPEGGLFTPVFVRGCASKLVLTLTIFIGEGNSVWFAVAPPLELGLSPLLRSLLGGAGIFDGEAATDVLAPCSTFSITMALLSSRN
jgi:hypothetical protein